jgi:RNA polymerase sigma-70 factor, ECF subfamily
MDCKTSVRLFGRARDGDQQALDELLQRYLPRLQRWASGRLPRSTRDLTDTDDLVQDTIIRTLRHIGTFEFRHDGALQAYLRNAILNRIRDECRRVARRPTMIDAQTAPGLADTAASPLDETLGREAVERYEAALTRLREEDREAVIARVELGCSYEEIAESLGKPSVAAARMAVGRALMRLAEAMRDAS